WSATISSPSSTTMRSGMAAHQHHPAGGTRIDAVAIMIGHDQASGAGPDGFLDEPVEGTAQLHQACAFFLEHLPDGPILELRVLGSLGVKAWTGTRARSSRQALTNRCTL